MLGVGYPIVERQKWPLDYKWGGCHSLVGTNGKSPHRAGPQRQAILLILFSSILGLWGRGQEGPMKASINLALGSHKSVCSSQEVLVPGFSSPVIELWHWPSCQWREHHTVLPFSLVLDQQNSRSHLWPDAYEHRFLLIPERQERSGDGSTLLWSQKHF